MISAFTFRVPKALFLLLIPVNLILIFVTVLYMTGRMHDSKEFISSSIKALNDKWDFDSSNTVAGGQDSNDLSTLDKYGYVIKPQEVKFKFINPKNKQGNPKEILKHNTDEYEKLMKIRINEPKNADIDSMRPPAEGDFDKYQYESATIIALVRNSEASNIGKSIKRFEKRFNSKFRYPYTFINDQPFNEKFKKHMASLSQAEMHFVEIPSNLWDKPEIIDPEKQKKLMDELASKDIAYAQKESYHNMCRFYSGTFYKLPELQKFKYYWRIEPDVDFYTDINYDVFKYMRQTKKKYGFTVNLYDIAETVPSLWPETLKFLNMGDNYKYVNPNGAFQWLLDDLQNPNKNAEAGGYSCCHFWSNFEIGDLDFFRGEAYDAWFNYLDSTGNFYYERWGDAPVHSVGLALFADKNDIHWFRDIGYVHTPYMNCPNRESASCDAGRFTPFDSLLDQNCMTNWIDYSMDDPNAIY
ncbi:Piso0_001239 [Millerozyma farinosa CBS 7064]|uniref:Piso0_001239 protein n=1 Tax=Pichia sorbitophila (strain ATCC MYA-4447 / BCRC 22081 / CBS 7064 / NBRC 10061 / NRRL Y-12695) TaxID=559304 RepID=G8YMM3_PICSO|nr:Piso0_001239 [Millerozyma farinosa CBS 7064]